MVGLDLHCQNALAWTITTDLEPRRDQVVIHCVINRKAHSQDFIGSISRYSVAVYFC